MDLDHPYLKKHLIAYIGNKRALQPLLYKVFTRITAEHCTASRPITFLDPFAGSGSVSRLARWMGFRVLANDWEYYAYLLNYAHLCVGRSEAEGLFAGKGPAGVFAELNSLDEPAEQERYISCYYAPASTADADYRRERLFYTRENALKIDALRNRIEQLYPEPSSAGKEKVLLLASLLYQCATHTNTSGVFKACHKGFGGHSRDALKRILAPIRLEVPVLIDGGEPAEVACQEAAEFARSRPAEICYLDPPYNQHQYGSNYHLLNTIALWDKPPVDNGLQADGRLKHKAGIRRDWVRTRSPYCYRQSAFAAFRQLLETIDARTVVLSYNTEGIINFDELVDLLHSQGKVELFTNEYVKYRGGKQSIGRQVHNLELALVLDRSRSGSKRDREKVASVVLVNRVSMMLKRSFHPQKIRRSFGLDSEEAEQLPLRLGGGTVFLPMPNLYRFDSAAALLHFDGLLQNAAPAELRSLLAALGSCECGDRREEIEIVIGILRRSPLVSLQRRALWLLRKFAHRKYQAEFEETLSGLRLFCRRQPDSFPVLAEGLSQVEELARARFEG